MLPSSSDLYYFSEVATSTNLSRAAERLGISQPSLSLAIQRLESTIGTPLLIRTKKGVTLTQAGKQLYLHSRELLQVWEKTKNRALASMNEVQGALTLGCHPSVAIYSLPLLLQDFLEKYRGVEIRLLHDLSRKVMEAVIRTEVDVAIVVNPIRHPDLIIQKLCNDKVKFWVGPGHRQIQDFRTGNGVLICNPEFLQTQSLLNKMKKSGIRYGRLISSSNLEVITQLTACGAGIGIIPERVASTALARGLRPIPKTPEFDDEICLIYRVENKNVRLIQEICKVIKDAFRTT